MEIGVVIHGPEVIDSGRALTILEYLKRFGRPRACVGGTMGAVAVLDAGLENVIDISRKEKVSDALMRLEPDVDALVLLNLAKTRESGRAFGTKVLERLPRPPKCPLVQIDGEFVIPLNQQAEELAKRIAGDLELTIEKPNEPKKMKDCRIVEGVLPGENIWINGKVIGRAVTDKVVIRKDKNGKITFEGIEIKHHGLEKLGNFDINTCIIRSGTVRRTSPPPRMIQQNGGNKVLFIDHDAEHSFNISHDLKGAVTVGDDTTRIAGTLFFRLGVPVVGITDGDEDGICSEKMLAPGSLILITKAGTDDIVGREVKEKIFGGRQVLETEKDFSTLADQIERIATDRLVKVYRS